MVFFVLQFVDLLHTTHLGGSWGVGLILSPTPRAPCFTSPRVETLITKDIPVGLTGRYTSS